MDFSLVMDRRRRNAPAGTAPAPSDQAAMVLFSRRGGNRTQAGPRSILRKLASPRGLRVLDAPWPRSTRRPRRRAGRIVEGKAALAWTQRTRAHCERERGASRDLCFALLPRLDIARDTCLPSGTESNTEDVPDFSFYFVDDVNMQTDSVFCLC
jgi:hypothetical protein